MTANLLDGERLDDLQNGYYLIQRKNMFCLGTDSVLLADFAAVRAGDLCADLGCGNGAIALLLAGKRRDVIIDGVEIQQQAADMARRSVAYNHLDGRVRIHHMDMRACTATLGCGKYSLVVCNPPYGAKDATLLNPNESERVARHETDLTPRDVADAAAGLLKFGGRFCVVYPAMRMLEMLDAMRGASIEPKRIRPVQARAAKEPKVMLIEGMRGARPGLRFMAPLLLYDEAGEHSTEWHRIYDA